MTSVLLTIDRRRPDPGVLDLAASVVRAGGIIVYPTETLYGIGGNARETTAVGRVLAAKKRPEHKPVPVVVHAREMLSTLVASIPPEAAAVMDAFWPGPLTIVFRALAGLAPGLTAGTGTIGVRVPSGAVALGLLELLQVPLTSTSANIAGEPVPPTVPLIRAQLEEAVDLYLDAGTLPPSAPSSVLDLSGERPLLLREGAIAFERLREVVPGVLRRRGGGG